MESEEMVKELVIARLQAMPETVGVSFGSDFDFLTKDQMIKHVEDGDQVGNEIVEIQMNFLRSFKEPFFNE